MGVMVEDDAVNYGYGGDILFDTVLDMMVVIVAMVVVEEVVRARR